MKDLAYTNIDGLDPSQGLLDAAMQKKLYQKTFCCYVTPDIPTPVSLTLYWNQLWSTALFIQIADNTYDALLCSAGMFPGSIVPQAFTELLRVVKPGGVITWNIADGYEVCLSQPN